MDSQPISELLPGLYRAVLDAVANLESVGRRREAAEIRSEATAVYSKAWTTDAAVRLRNLAVRAARIVEGRRRPRSEPVFEAIGRQVDLERTTA
jgi:hypothetical protein